jgi:autotransporter-associated beta strand protein
MRAHLLATTAVAAALLAATSALAQDATWLLNPGSGNFNTAANWTPATVPTGTAFFGTSNITNLSFTPSTTNVGGFTFNAGASNYTFVSDFTLINFNGAGIVINGGSATITNNFLLNFNNSSTAGSATINNNGALSFNNSSTAGVAAINNNASLNFNNGSTAGGATITNNSALAFNDQSMAGHATIINNGTLGFSNSSTAASATITNNDTGTLVFGASSTAGNATITNNDSVKFTDTSTAGGATITNNNGELRFSNSSTAGSATINNTNNGFLVFEDSSTAGSATITNTTGMVFNNNSTAGSATVTNRNLLLFNDSSTAGSATITNNGFLGFFGTGTGGTARLINGSVGTLDLPGLPPEIAEQFKALLIGAGMTATIDLSGLTGAGMTAGSIEGAGTIRLGSKNLAVGANNLSTTFAGILQDGGSGGGTGGSLTKTGTGTLTLTGTNTYTGATTIDGGALIVNGSIASSSLTTVNNGGTLGGAGTVGNTQVNSGGTFAPGNSPGTITVVGNLAFQSGALYLVQVNSSTASSANVTAGATLAGTVQAAFASGSSVARNYTVLSAAGGLNGTFNALNTTNLPPGFTASLSYTPTAAILNLTATLGGGDAAGGGAAGGGACAFSVNQCNVANALNAFFNNGGTLPPAFVTIFGLTGGNLANALTLLSGEAATGAQQVAFQLINQFLGIMLDPFVDGRNAFGGGGSGAIGFAPEREELPEEVALAYAKVLKAPPKPAAFEQRWSVWGAGYGGSNRTSGDPAVVGSHDLSARTAGGTAGLDYHVSRDSVVGVALAGGGTDWSLSQGLGGGKSDAFQAGVYGTARWGPAYLAAALSFTNHWMSTDRFAFAGDHLTASFNAQSFGGRVEGGYRFATTYGGLTPYAAGAELPHPELQRERPQRRRVRARL